MHDQEQRGSLFDVALATVQDFGVGRALTARIATLEHSLAGLSRDGAVRLLRSQQIDAPALDAALIVKDASSQIDVIIHALGILTSLPFILEKGEVVQSLSLGAGNTGRAHDLVTDAQIAEFKFIRWRGGSEAIRQNTVFVDIFNLATADTDKRRVLYLLDKQHALRFLGNRRAIASVLSKSASAHARFTALYGDRYQRVHEYWQLVRERVEIVDLRDVVPALRVVA